MLELIVDRKEKETEDFSKFDMAPEYPKRRGEQDEPEGVLKLIKTDTLKRFLANANFLIQKFCERDHGWEGSVTRNEF